MEPNFKEIAYLTKSTCAKPNIPLILIMLLHLFLLILKYPIPVDYVCNVCLRIHNNITKSEFEIW